MKDKHNKVQDGEDFSLYTEKIVVNPFVRYKKIFAVIKFIVLAIIFGLIASTVMAWVYPKLVEKQGKPVDKDKGGLVFDKDEYPSDAIMDETESDSQKETKPSKQEPTEEDPIETEPPLSYVELLEKIQKSIVVITDKEEISESLPQNPSAPVVPVVPGEEKVNDTVGVIIGELGGKYMVLTSYTAVNTFKQKIIKIGDETEVTASVFGVDARTDVALLCFSKYDLTDYENTLVAVAKLDNSYVIKQGDAFVAAGKLYGKLKAADKGFITSITTEMAVDNCYGLMSAGIRALQGDYCFLFNGKGNVIGVSKLVDQETKFVANGTSDLKGLIEKLSAHADIIYLGIRGTNVTSSMVTNYNLPYGIYVTEVVIDSPAFKAGLHVGDVITAVDGVGLLAMQQLSDKLYNCTNGQQIGISVKRQSMTGYKDMTFTATLSIR